MTQKVKEHIYELVSMLDVKKPAKLCLKIYDAIKQHKEEEKRELR